MNGHTGIAASRVFTGSILAAVLAAIPSPASAKTILIIGPHPDDETLIAAGRARSGLLDGDTVKMVVVTNGDANGVATGLFRQGESVAAAQVLGLTEQDVIFLGYPDGSLLDIFRSASGTQLFISSAGQTATYGSRGLGGMEYHRLLYGVAGLYNRDTILADLRTLFADTLPDEIYTVSQYDAHEDHQAVARLVIEALVSLERIGVPLSTKLYQTLVWVPDTNWGLDSWPAVGTSGFTPFLPFQRPASLSQTQLDWERIHRFPVPAEMQAGDPASNLKYQAISQYTSQLSTWLTSFSRKDEFFWLTDFGTNLAFTAQVSVSSEDVDLHECLKAVDGMLYGAFGFYNEWITLGELSGAWIQLTWPSPVMVSQVNLFDRPDTSENILSGTLSFSDGSTVAVGGLPVDGRALTVMSPPRVVTWVRFTADQAQGSAVGLSEIQVLGISSSASPHLPPNFVWGPVPVPDTISQSQTATLSAAANDLEGDSYFYEWLVDGGSIQDNGASAVFTPPAVGDGVYTVTTRVVDSQGTATSNVNFVTVSSSGPTLPALSALSLNPSSVTGGYSATGMVTLTAAAPSDGVVVTLSCDQTAVATVPATVTIPAGAYNAVFTVDSAAVVVTSNATISAGYQDVSRTAMLTVSPSSGGSGTATFGRTVEGSAWAAFPPNPGSISASRFTLTENASVTKLSVIWNTAVSGHFLGVIYRAEGANTPTTLVASTTEINSVTVGTNDLPFGSPVNMTPGDYYLGVYGDQDSGVFAQGGTGDNVWYGLDYTGVAPETWDTSQQFVSINEKTIYATYDR